MAKVSMEITINRLNRLHKKMALIQNENGNFLQLHSRWKRRELSANAISSSNLTTLYLCPYRRLCVSETLFETNKWYIYNENNDSKFKLWATVLVLLSINKL